MSTSKQDIFYSLLGEWDDDEKQITEEWGGLGPDMTKDDWTKDYHSASDLTPEQAGCEYCHKSLGGRLVFYNQETGVSAYIVGYLLYVEINGQSGIIPIGHCPVCGRKLGD